MTDNNKVNNRCPNCNFDMQPIYKEGERYLQCVNSLCGFTKPFPPTVEEKESWR